MDAVVLYSDIARLVLGYLKRQNLERTSRLFCKTSPHLKQEFSAYRKGFTPHNFGPNLEDIICEYVNISRTVEGIVSSLPNSLRLQLFERKLSEKVKLLLERALESYLKNEKSESASLRQSDTKHSSTISTSLHSDKENTAKIHDNHKRKRSSLVYSSDERKSPVSLRNKSAKRRRILESFCYLSGKRHNLQRQRQTLNASSTGEDQTQTDDGVEEESVNEEGIDLNEEVAIVIDNESDLSLMEKPTKESTPRNKSGNGKFLTPSVPELSQAILDNPHFQMKLVDNINEALNNSTSTEATLCNLNTLSANVLPNSDTLSEEQQIINSNEMLDQMVKDILKATEKDPAFDAIIENVVGASVQPGNVSAGVQCNIDDSALQPLLSMATVPAIVGQQQQSQHFTIMQQQQQHLSIPCLSAVSQDTAAVTSVPRTPLIIRNAVAAASASVSGGCGAVAGPFESQVLSTLTANNSFGSLIDPNFSISKLIVLNPNDSAQKQPHTEDQSIGNTTTDHLINQLTSGTATTGDEQVYFDANTGQLTIPLFLTDEGLLANFPFLINNEAVSQQLQPDNICNMDGSRIEIPLPEPIIVSADQLPPNSIILTSAQKADTVEEQRFPGAIQPPRTVCKQLKAEPVPSSLNACSNADGETPSTSGIINTKALKTLSTPRKRSSHVRLLSFSPKIDTNRAIVQTVAAPLSVRREVQRDNANTQKVTPVGEETTTISTDIPDRPIIKNVEILPRLDGPIDVSANESSNSCSVPPLFVTEESSNQTVIKTELSHRENKGAVKAKAESKTTIGDHTDTPKRKQVRRSAVRACKRQLSKSSDESDKPKLLNQSDNSESKETPIESEEKVKEQQQAKMMEEWLRLRNATTSDLDSRLRQLNADQYAAVPQSARRTRVTPRKRRKLRRKKPAISKRMRKKAAAQAILDKDHSDASADVKETKIKNKSERKSKSESKTREKAPKTKSRDKSLEFNIKIPTPQKEKRESLKKINYNRAESATAESATEEIQNAVVSTALQDDAKQTDCNQIAPKTEERLQHERGRRTANIACLLDTPFKAPITLGDVPPTPGIPGPCLDTPASKISDLPLSTSYLFGSLTKSELETPQLSAITPGFRFTPFGSSRDVTPRSIGPTTDYSSGGSYYKPDESDDLDRNFDKLLKDSAQKHNQEEEEKMRSQVLHSNAEEIKNALFEERRKSPEPDREQKEDAICVEIPAEKLRVEPIVLKRVKSFGAESTENGEGGTAPMIIDPHYTLVSELPEICAEEESSNSSSTFSSSSSSSSDSSSTSSSSSSSSSEDAHKEETVEGADEQLKTPDNINLSLDNLSSISSTEDEEWQKLAVTEEENSQLVSNDGEVRYPVRSWLTPSKVENQPTADTPERSLSTIIKVNVPLKSAEKRNRLEEDLQQKRERMMEKLKKDASLRREKHSNVPTTPPSGITAALSATRKIAAMREKTKIQPKKISIHAATSTISEPIQTKPIAVVEERTIEVLTALQLSARKLQKPSVAESKPRTPAIAPPMNALDDNAMSTPFSKPSTSTAYELTDKTERLPLKKLISKVKSQQRQCMQIEPRPALKLTRSSGVVRKKIVRKPLGFKGTPALDAAGKIEHIKEVQSPFRLAAKSVQEDESEKSTGKRPIGKIKIKTPIGPTPVTGSKLRVSPRLRGNTKKQKVNDSDLDEEEEDEGESKTLKTQKAIKSMSTRATAAKALLKPRIQIKPVRTRITKCKKAAQKVGFKTASDESSDVEIITTDAVQEKMHVDKMKLNKQEHAAEMENEKSEKNRSSAGIKKEKQAGVIAKEQTKSPDPVVSSEVTTSIEVTEAKSIKSETLLSRRATATAERLENSTTPKKKDMPQRATATADNHGKGTAAKREDTLRPKIRSLEKTSIAADEPEENASKEQREHVQKAETSNPSKLNVDKAFTANDETQYKATKKDEITQKGSVEQASVERTTTPTSTTNAEPTTIETSEDDPLEGCELVSVTDDDPVRFISVIYSGPDMPPSNPLPRRDFSNFKMVVAFDENDKHIWRVTDELMLFHASPATQQIRNIPKKRKVRINTCGSDQDNVATVGVVHSTTTTLATTSATSTMTIVSSSNIAKNANNNSREATPIATSTPISAPATSSTQNPKKLVPKITPTSADAASTSSLTTTATATSITSACTTEVIQMDDIESLLSHLHGKAN